MERNAPEGRRSMSKRNLFKILFAILLILLIGSFSFAEDKKTLPPTPTNSPKKECPEDSEKNQNPKTTPPASKTAPEKGSNLEPLSPSPSSPFKFQNDQDDG